MRSPHLRLTLLLLALLAACGKNLASGSSAAGRDRNVITQEELQDGHFRTAYEAVRALRANWLVAKGTDSFQSPTEVQVYFNDSRLGGVDNLRSIAIPGITYIRYFDGLSASARWGMNHGQGVIYVSSRAP